jgi:hypothetical protein
MMPADALHGARQDQLARVGAERRRDGGQGEDGDAGDEDGAPPEPVADRDGHQDEAGEHQRVGVDEPLQLFDGGAEVGVDHRQRVGHDQVVEGRHEHRDAGGEHREDERDATCGHVSLQMHRL